MEWPNHMVILFKNFCRTSILFSMEAAPFCIPTNSTQCFQFLYILINPGHFLFLWRSHPNCAEVYHIVIPLVFETEFLENCSAFQPLHLRGQKKVVNKRWVDLQVIHKRQQSSPTLTLLIIWKKKKDLFFPKPQIPCLRSQATDTENYVMV